MHTQRRMAGVYGEVLSVASNAVPGCRDTAESEQTHSDRRHAWLRPDIDAIRRFRGSTLHGCRPGKSSVTRQGDRAADWSRTR